MVFGVATRVREAAARWRRHQAAAMAEKHARARPFNVPQHPHGMDGRLVVSLTSYPPRFATLYPTLRLLMSQTVAPDDVVLWIAEGDRAQLPPEVESLRSSGLLIETCEDYGPFKKFVGSRRRWPSAHIVTVDDDVAYPPTMLEELIEGFRAGVPAVIAHRARRMTFGEDGPTGYDTWPLVDEGGVQSDMLLPNGVGGVLYPAGSIPERALDVETFRRLTRTNDDPWLMWMSRRAGFSTRTVARPREWIDWNGSQKVGLWVRENTGPSGRNNGYIRALWREFGEPVAA